jgi:hypothetical protein
LDYRSTLLSTQADEGKALAAQDYIKIIKLLFQEPDCICDQVYAVVS